MVAPEPDNEEKLDDEGEEEGEEGPGPSSSPNPFAAWLRENGVERGGTSKTPIYSYEMGDQRTEIGDDAPKYRKRTLLRLEAMERAQAYWKSQRHLTDEEWCAKHCQIVNKRSKLVPFIFNPAQRILAAKIREQLRKYGMVRLVVLKARQLGMSLVIQALLWRELLESQNEKAIVMADEDEPADNVFERTRIFRDDTRFPMYPFKYSSRREIAFELPHRSQIRVLVSTFKGKGHGGTYRKLHLSEVAHWKNAKGNLTRLLGGLSDEDGTWCIWESTAKGIGGEFHDKYWAAKRGESGNYEALFLPWHIDPDYRIKGAKLDRYHVEPEALADEVALRAQGCDDEQLAFRRFKINEKYNGDVDMWRQEMPSTDREAFIAAGRCVFPKQKVGNLLTVLTERDRERPPVRMHIEPRGYEEWRKLATTMREDRRVPDLDGRGYLWIYNMPQPGKKYVIGADVAAGKEVDNEDGRRGGDYSVAHVYDRETGKQVAVYRHRLDSDLYGCVLDILGRWYNDALLAPEVNNMGLVTIKCLLRLGYKNLYLREKVDVATAANAINPEMYGWVTTGPSKTVGVGSLIRLFRTSAIHIQHANTAREMTTFVYLQDGSMGAAEKKAFDDEITAAFICASILETTPLNEMARPAMQMNERSPAYYLQMARNRMAAEEACGSSQLIM